MHELRGVAAQRREEVTGRESHIVGGKVTCHLLRSDPTYIGSA
jgi:hypothetical protein